jgi:DNA-binding MarR family transcriptional regulator
MPDPDNDRAELDRFLLERIETVPHLEALLLLWNSRPKTWFPEAIADALYVPPDSARPILDDLVRQNLIAVSGSSAGYFYESEPGRDRLAALVDLAYRHELIRITRLIHSKPSAAIREFARAFRLRKEHE